MVDRAILPAIMVLPDLFGDPFRERSSLLQSKPLALLGGRFQFASNSRRLLSLAELAFAGLPRHRLSTSEPRLRVTLWLESERRAHRRSEPPPLAMMSGGGLLAGAPEGSSFVSVSPQDGSALIVMSRDMLRFPYHARYELIEFAVFTLAARAQGLAPLHAACVGRDGRGVLLMGASGSGKSTVALHCLLRGLDFLSEDSVFVAPATLLATGIANFLHVRSDSLRWLAPGPEVAAIRSSPVIQRRSGVKKFEVNLRQRHYRLAPAPLQISSIVFLSSQSAGGRPLLRPLSRATLLSRLSGAQACALNQPEWATFSRHAARLDSFELRRGGHPLESVDVLDRLLRFGTRQA